MWIVGSRTLKQSEAEIGSSPRIPIDDDGPVFREPWEAQAFALAIALYEKECFTWKEWANALSQELKAAGETQSGDDYYLCWLAALEKLLVGKDIAAHSELLSRKNAWARAAAATPHGEPIVLGRELGHTE